MTEQLNSTDLNIPLSGCTTDYLSMTRWWYLDSAGKRGFGKARQGDTRSWRAGHAKVTKGAWRSMEETQKRPRVFRFHGEKGIKLSVYNEIRSWSKRSDGICCYRKQEALGRLTAEE